MERQLLWRVCGCTAYGRKQEGVQFCFLFISSVPILQIVALHTYIANVSRRNMIWYTYTNSVLIPTYTYSDVHNIIACNGIILHILLCEKRLANLAQCADMKCKMIMSSFVFLLALKNCLRPCGDGNVSSYNIALHIYIIFNILVLNLFLGTDKAYL